MCEGAGSKEVGPFDDHPLLHTLEMRPDIHGGDAVEVPFLFVATACV